MVQRVTQLTAAVIAAMIAEQALVLAVHGLLVVQVPTIRIVATERTPLETVPEFMAQPVAARHPAEVLTTKLTVTPSLDATGRQPSH
jgi:hypothetical protein